MGYVPGGSTRDEEPLVVDERLEIHNANTVNDVASAGGCGLKNLQNGATCGLEFGHDGPCNFIPPEDVVGALAAKGIEV
jgi:hypothetical protein